MITNSFSAKYYIFILFVLGILLLPSVKSYAVENNIPNLANQIRESLQNIDVKTTVTRPIVIEGMGSTQISAVSRPIEIEGLGDNSIFSATSRPIVIEGMGSTQISAVTRPIEIEGLGDNRIFSATSRPIVIEGMGSTQISAVSRPIEIEGLGDSGVLSTTSPPIIIQGTERSPLAKKIPLPNTNDLVLKNKKIKAITEDIIRKSASSPRITSIKLLQVRATSRGGSLPFDRQDIQEEISPIGIITAQENAATVTCSNQTFPVAGFTTAPIFILFPDSGGECEVGNAVSDLSEVAIRFTPFSASTATVTGLNGWSADQPDVTYGIGMTFANSLIVSRNGISYTIGIDAQGTGIGGFPIRISVSSFSGPN